MPNWIRTRPWIWPMALLLIVALVNVGMLIIAISNPPIPVEGP